MGGPNSKDLFQEFLFAIALGRKPELATHVLQKNYLI